MSATPLPHQPGEPAMRPADSEAWLDELLSAEGQVALSDEGFTDAVLARIAGDEIIAPDAAPDLAGQRQWIRRESQREARAWTLVKRGWMGGVTLGALMVWWFPSGAALTEVGGPTAWMPAAQGLWAGVAAAMVLVTVLNSGTKGR